MKLHAINRHPSEPVLNGNRAVLTMLCLRILWTTGVNTSITTIDRGRSRQCCDTQEWPSTGRTFKCLKVFNFKCCSSLRRVPTTTHDLTLQKNSHRSGGGWLFSRRGAMAYTHTTHTDEYSHILSLIYPGWEQQYRSGLSGAGVL